MAKKVVAKLKDTSGKNMAKVIRAMKSPKTGAYMYKEVFMNIEDAKKLLTNKSS